MKLLIVSDLHANASALKNIWEHEGGADLVVCAGDCVDFGFEPHETIAFLREHNVIAVAGNHDHEILDRFEEREAIRAKDDSELRTFAEYNIKNMTDEDFEYLRSLPEVVRFSFDGYDYLMTHTFDMQKADYIARNLQSYSLINYFSEIRKKYTDLDKNAPLRIIDGHTHSAMINHVADGKFWINSGGVSYRVGADHQSKGSDYIVVEDGQFRFGHLRYDSSWMVEKLASLNFEEWHDRVGHSFWDPEVLPD